MGSGLHASLFLQPAHLRAIAIPGSVREALGASLRLAGLRLRAYSSELARRAERTHACAVHAVGVLETTGW